MFAAVLLTDPAAPRWTRAGAGALQRLGRQDLRWLAPDEAAEFRLPAAPIPSSRRRPNCRHGASTWRSSAEGAPEAPSDRRHGQHDDPQECIDELADEAGVGAHVAGITARAMNGELDFEAALRERVALLEGLPEAVIGQVLRDRITLMPGGPCFWRR